MAVSPDIMLALGADTSSFEKTLNSLKKRVDKFSTDLSTKNPIKVKADFADYFSQITKAEKEFEAFKDKVLNSYGGKSGKKLANMFEISEEELDGELRKYFNAVSKNEKNRLDLIKANEERIRKVREGYVEQHRKERLELKKTINEERRLRQQEYAERRKELQSTLEERKKQARHQANVERGLAIETAKKARQEAIKNDKLLREEQSKNAQRALKERLAQQRILKKSSIKTVNDVSKLQEKMDKEVYQKRMNLWKQEQAKKLKDEKERQAALNKTAIGAMMNGTTFGHKFITTAQYTTAAIALMGLRDAFNAMKEESVAYDDALYNNMAVLNANRQEAEALAKTSRELSKVYGGNIQEIDKVVLTLGRAGVEMRDLADATETVIQLSKITGDTVGDTSKVVSTFRENFKDAGISVTTLGERIAYMANESKMSTEDLGTFANYGLQTAKNLNLTVNTVGALATTMSNLGINASTIGTQMQKLDFIFNGGQKSVKYFWDILAVTNEELGTQEEMLKAVSQGGLEGEKAFIKFAKAVNNMGEDQFNTATRGMEIRTKNLLLAIRNGFPLLDEHMKKIKTVGDLTVQASIASMGASATFEKIGNTIATQFDGLVTSLLDFGFDRNKLQEDYEALIREGKAIAKLDEGTEEYNQRLAELTKNKQALKDKVEEANVGFSVFVKQLSNAVIAAGSMATAIGVIKIAMAVFTRQAIVTKGVMSALTGNWAGLALTIGAGALAYHFTDTGEAAKEAAEEMKKYQDEAKKAFNTKTNISKEELASIKLADLKTKIEELNKSEAAISAMMENPKNAAHGAGFERALDAVEKRRKVLKELFNEQQKEVNRLNQQFKEVNIETAKEAKHRLEINELTANSNGINLTALQRHKAMLDIFEKEEERISTMVVGEARLTAENNLQKEKLRELIKYRNEHLKEMKEELAFAIKTSEFETKKAEYQAKINNDKTQFNAILNSELDSVNESIAQLESKKSEYADINRLKDYEVQMQDFIIQKLAIQAEIAQKTRDKKVQDLDTQLNQLELETAQLNLLNKRKKQTEAIGDEEQSQYQRLYDSITLEVAKAEELYGAKGDEKKLREAILAITNKLLAEEIKIYNLHHSNSGDDSSAKRLKTLNAELTILKEGAKQFAIKAEMEAGVIGLASWEKKELEVEALKEELKVRKEILAEIQKEIDKEGDPAAKKQLEAKYAKEKTQYDETSLNLMKEQNSVMNNILESAIQLALQVYDSFIDKLKEGKDFNDAFNESLTDIGPQITAMMKQSGNPFLMAAGYGMEILGALMSSGVTQEELDAAKGQVEFTDESLSNLQSMFENAQYPMLKLTKTMSDHIRNMDKNFVSIARALTGTSVAFDLTASDYASTSKASFLGFSSKSIELIGSGLQFYSQSLAELMDQNSLEVYAYLTEKVTKSSFWGLSSSTSIRTTLNDLPDDVIKQMADSFAYGYETLLTAGVGLGFSEDKIASALQAATIELDKVSFEGLSDDEISDRLSNTFSQALSSIANQVVEFTALIDRYALNGEDSLETLVRLAYSYEQAAYQFELIGKSFDNIANGVEVTTTSFVTEVVQATSSMTGNWGFLLDKILEMTNATTETTTQVVETFMDTYTKQMRVLDIIDSIGGIDKFNDAMSAFMANFYTEEEQLIMMTKAMVDSFATLGITMPKTNEEFRNLIETMDTSTEEGAYLYGQVLSLAEGFAEMTSAAEAFAESTAASAEEIKDATTTALNNLVSAWTGSLSYLTLQDRAIYASKALSLGIGNPETVDSVELARVMAETAMATSVTKEDYIPAFDEYIRALENEVPDATNSDLLEELQLIREELEITRQQNKTLALQGAIA